MSANPGKLKRLSEKPVGIIPNTISVLRDPSADQFLDMLNQALENVKYSGAEKKIFEKYETLDIESFYPTARPYEVK